MSFYNIRIDCRAKTIRLQIGFDWRIGLEGQAEILKKCTYLAIGPYWTHLAKGSG